MNEGIFLSNQTVGKFNLQGDCDSKTLMEIHSKFLNAADKMEKHGFFTPIKYNLVTLVHREEKYIEGASGIT